MCFGPYGDIYIVVLLAKACQFGKLINIDMKKSR